MKSGPNLMSFASKKYFCSTATTPEKKLGLGARNSDLGHFIHLCPPPQKKWVRGQKSDLEQYIHVWATLNNWSHNHPVRQCQTFGWIFFFTTVLIHYNV